MSIQTNIKIFLKGLAIASFSISGLLVSPQGVKAEDFTYEECPDSGSTDATVVNIDENMDGECLHTPDKYELTIYEMGLCTNHPLTGNVGSKVFDKSSCEITMVSTTGTVVDLAPGTATSKTSQLPSATSRPASNSYSYAYIILNTEFNLKGSYTLANGTTYYTKPGTDSEGYPYGEADSSLSAALGHTDDIDNLYFGDDSLGWDGEMTATDMPGGGKVSALLLKECTGAACEGTEGLATTRANTDRLLGVFETNAGSPVVIKDSTKGVEVELVVKKSGYVMWLNDEGDEIGGFGSAPFKPVFSVF